MGRDITGTVSEAMIVFDSVEDTQWAVNGPHISSTVTRACGSAMWVDNRLICRRVHVEHGSLRVHAAPKALLTRLEPSRKVFCSYRRPNQAFERDWGYLYAGR